MIHIACCTDDAYTEPCGILMISICENKGNESIHFHILTNTILSSNEKILRDIAKRYGQVISIYKVNENNLKNCPIQKNDCCLFQNPFTCNSSGIYPKNFVFGL